jgi:hypothetical protein
MPATASLAPVAPAVGGGGLTDDEPVWGLGDVFTCREYTTRRYRFRMRDRSRGDEVVPLDALAAASTDFDLTGQVVWLVSVLTSHYVASELRDVVAGQDVLELGAGAGLVGLTAARWARSVVLSDYEDEVLSLLERNLRHVPRGCGGRVFNLSWGDEGDHRRLAAETGRQRWRVIVGADIVYWGACIEPLVQTVKVRAPAGRPASSQQQYGARRALTCP